MQGIDPEDPQPFPENSAITVDNVDFSYPSREDFRLEGINFDLKEGQILAIVGPSGSGKSTLGNLLLRFWGGYKGEIKIGETGVELGEIDQDQVRRKISTISQADYLFRDTIQANISLGDPESSLDKVKGAAKKAGFFMGLTYQIYKKAHRLLAW